MTPQKIKRISSLLLLTAAATVLWLTWRQPAEYSLAYYSAKGLVDTGKGDSAFLAEYVRTALPPDQSGLFAAPANLFRGTKIHIIKSDSARQAGFQPYNAMYDPAEDAVFLDYRLLKLAEVGRGAAGGRTLLAFVLLHELGHRQLHRYLGKKEDFMGFGESGTGQAGDLGLFGKNIDTASMRREQEADGWAADHYLDMLPRDSSGIFINEPDSLPLLNLIEGGLLTAISQNGPYSPILQNKSHPALYSRVLNFMYALSQSKKLRPRDALFYSMEAMKLQKFLQHLQRFLAIAVVLPEGDIPVSAALDRDTLWVLSYKNNLYHTVLTPGGTDIPHINVKDDRCTLPEPEDQYDLYHSGKNLFVISKEGKIVYLFDRHAHRWRYRMTLPGENNVWSGNRLYSSQYDGSRMLTVYAADPESGKVAVYGRFNCAAAISVYPFTLHISETTAYLSVLDDLQVLSVYMLRDGQATLLRSFNDINDYEFDEGGRYLQLSYDRDKLPDSVKNAFHYDRFGRPYAITFGSGSGIVLRDVGLYIGAVDIFDLGGDCYVRQNLTENADCGTDGTPDRSPAGKISFLHKEYYTAVDSVGQIIMTDDLLRPTDICLSARTGARQFGITHIPYSRYLLVFDFSHPRELLKGYSFTIRAVDL